MRLGLLAAARITEQAVIEPARLVDDVEVAAIAARDPARAREAAERWGIPTVQPTYEDLLTDTSLDAVYVATPAALHRAPTVTALGAGLHVLCEKPFAANADDARTMVAAASSAGRVLTEAFHWCYHPFAAQLRELVDSGRIGELRRIEGRFILPDGEIPRDDIRWDLALGGGALMDLGCYPLHWARWLTDEEPTVTSAVADCEVPGVDARLTAELEWSSGVTGSIATAMIGTDLAIDLTISGTDGTVTAVNPLAPQHGASLTLARAGHDDESIPVREEPSATYFHQLVAFRDAVASGVPTPTGGADSIATMELIDACYRAAGLEPRPTFPD